MNMNGEKFYIQVGCFLSPGVISSRFCWSEDKNWKDHLHTMARFMLFLFVLASISFIAHAEGYKK